MFVKPAPGLSVRDPVSMRLLDPAGEQKPDDLYWTRLRNDGDVVDVTPEPELALPQPQSRPTAKSSAKPE